MVNRFFSLILLLASNTLLAGQADEMFAAARSISWQGGPVSDASVGRVEGLVHANPRLLWARDSFLHQRTILHVVAARCHVDLVRVILAYQGDFVNLEAVPYLTPLMTAIRARDVARTDEHRAACENVVRFLHADTRAHLLSKCSVGVSLASFIRCLILDSKIES